MPAWALPPLLLLAPPVPPEADSKPKAEAGDESEVAPVEAVDLSEPASPSESTLVEPKTEGEMELAVVSIEQAER